MGQKMSSPTETQKRKREMGVWVMRRGLGGIKAKGQNKRKQKQGKGKEREEVRRIAFAFAELLYGLGSDESARNMQREGEREGGGLWLYGRVFSEGSWRGPEEACEGPPSPWERGYWVGFGLIIYEQ